MRLSQGTWRLLLFKLLKRGICILRKLVEPTTQCRSIQCGCSIAKVVKIVALLGGSFDERRYRVDIAIQSEALLWAI